MSVSHSDLSTIPASHDVFIETGRRFRSVATTFLTEADSNDSDQNCGPEVVPVDTDDELDRVVDALQYDLKDHVPSPVADLNSSAPRKRSPVGRESQVSQVVEVAPDDEHLIRPINGRHVVPRLEHESVDGSAQFAGVHDSEICAIVPVSSRVLRAVGHITIQNRFEALREDIVDVLGMHEPHCAATWFDMSTDSDKGVECSAGDPRSVVLGQCEAASASSNAVFRGRVALVCGDRARSATHIRERVPDRISQTTTLAPVEEPSSGSDASAMESPKSMGGIRVYRGTPDNSGPDGVVSSETGSLFGASEASGEEIVDSLPEVEVFMPNL